MAVGNGIGADVKWDGDILAPLYGSLVIEVAADEDVDALMAGAGYAVIGETTADGKLTVNGEAESVAEITAEWQEPVEGVFPVRTADFRNKKDTTAVSRSLYTDRNSAGPAIKIARPKVVIPAFPGTNCEVDSARAFRKAGADADIHIIRNLTTAQLEDSIRELEKKRKPDYNDSGWILRRRRTGRFCQVYHRSIQKPCNQGCGYRPAGEQRRSDAGYM